MTLVDSIKWACSHENHSIYIGPHSGIDGVKWSGLFHFTRKDISTLQEQQSLSIEQTGTKEFVNSIPISSKPNRSQQLLTQAFYKPAFVDKLFQFWVNFELSLDQLHHDIPLQVSPIKCPLKRTKDPLFTQWYWETSPIVFCLRSSALPSLVFVPSLPPLNRWM